MGSEPSPSPAYVPARGEVVRINLSATGSAQSGLRTAVVLSLAQHNDRDGRAMLCPITDRVKGVRSMVAIPKALDVAGVILVDQFRTLDWRQRNAELITRLPEETVATVMRKLDDLERRLHRAEELCALRNAGVSAAEAWRAVRPGTTANDRAAAEQARREIRRCHALLERLYGKRCGGVAGRPCEKRVASARHTYCPACSAERRRLRRQGYNRTYYRQYRVELLEDRRRRVHEARKRELAEFRDDVRRVAAEVRAKRVYAEVAGALKRREEGPSPVYDENGNLTWFFNHATGQWERTRNSTGGSAGRY